MYIKYKGAKYTHTTMSYHGDDNKECCWGRSRRQATFDAQICSNQLMKPNGGDVLG